MPNYDFGSMTYPNLSNASVEYYYDANGNLIKNLDKRIVSSRYNFLNLADTIQFQNGNQIINSYLADGRKVGAAYKTYMTGIMVPLDSVYHGMTPYTMAVDEWDGHYMYHRRSGSPDYTPEMFMVQTPEGYIGADHVGIDSRRNYAYYYYVHDHLGNVRITSNSQEYYVDQSLEYYPSGVLFDRSTETYRQPYMFGGKDLVSMHGLNVYDFNARMQDPVIPRFTSMDPLCEMYYSWSPYVYCMNNPIRYIDPTGKVTEHPINLFDKKRDKPVFHNVPNTWKYVKGDGKFTVFAHANARGIQYTNSKGNRELVKDPKKINEILSSKSEEWKEAIESGEEVSLTIYACNAGSNEYIEHGTEDLKVASETIAAAISKELPNVTVIAADGYVWYGIDKKGKPTIKGVENSNKDRGFITFKNGEKVAKRQQSYDPSTKIVKKSPKQKIKNE